MRDSRLSPASDEAPLPLFGIASGPVKGGTMDWIRVSVGRNQRRSHESQTLVPKQMSAARRPWKNIRKGFKHEFVLTLVDRGLSNREALQIVNATFACLKEALLRREPVHMEGFGRWYVEEVTRRRSWRFGKIIISKPYKVSFEIDARTLARAKAESWCPHPSWEVQRNHKPKLRGRKLVAFSKSKSGKDALNS